MTFLKLWDLSGYSERLKEQCPRGVLAKNEHFGANCLWDRSPVKLRKLHINPSKFFWVDPQKIRRVCMEFSEYNRLTTQGQFAPKWSFLVSRPLGHCSFRISLTSHAGVFRGARISSLPTNVCSTEDNIPFPSLANHIVRSKFWKVDLDRKVIW